MNREGRSFFILALGLRQFNLFVCKKRINKINIWERHHRRFPPEGEREKVKVSSWELDSNQSTPRFFSESPFGRVLLHHQW